MNYMSLICILNEDVTECIEYGAKSTWIRLNYADKTLFVTFWHDDLLVQKMIECPDPQVVSQWEVEIELHEFIYGLNIDRKQEYYWLDLSYDPTANKLIIKSDTETLKEISIPEKGPGSSIPLLDFLEEEPTGKVVFSEREWKKAQSAVAIARQADDSSILLEVFHENVFIRVNGRSVTGLYALKILGKANLFDTIDVPFQVFEYLDTQYTDYGYIKIESYHEMVVLQAGATTRIFLQPCLKLKLIHSVELLSPYVRVPVNKNELIKAIKNVSGEFDIKTPNADLVIITISSPTSLYLEGKKGEGEYRIPVKIPVEKWAWGQAYVSAKEILELIEALPDGQLQLVLPTRKFEPMGIQMPGIQICYAGFYLEARHLQKLPESIGFWDAAEPTQHEVLCRDQDESTLVITAIEHSPLDIHKTAKEIRFLEESMRDEQLEQLLELNYITYDYNLAEFRKVYRQVEKIKKTATALIKSKESDNRRAEVIKRLSEVQEIMDEMHYVASDEFPGNDGLTNDAYDTLNREIRFQIRCTINLRIKAGRLLDAILDQQKVYRLHMSVQPLPQNE